MEPCFRQKVMKSQLCRWNFRFESFAKKGCLAILLLHSFDWKSFLSVVVYTIDFWLFHIPLRYFFVIVGEIPRLSMKVNWFDDFHYILYEYIDITPYNVFIRFTAHCVTEHKVFYNIIICWKYSYYSSLIWYVFYRLWSSKPEVLNVPAIYINYKTNVQF